MTKRVINLFLYVLVISFAWAVTPASSETETEKVRAQCRNNNLLNVAYDCDCIGKKFEAARERDASTGYANVVNQVLTTDVDGCVQPEKIRAQVVKKCGMTYNIAYAKLHDAMKLGKSSFCHCLADESLKLLEGMDPKRIPTLAAGSTRALLACRKVASYAVPADSPFHPQQPIPIATLSGDEDINVTENQLYLIVVNGNFDLNRLDNTRYAVSDDYKSDRNIKYVTIKDQPVTELPVALIKRGAEAPGQIEARAISDVVDVAVNYNQAILVRGSQLKEILTRMQNNKRVNSSDYYVIIGDELYKASDLQARM